MLDVAAYLPADVRRSTEALRDECGRYVFVSSISVYADMSVPPAEGAEVLSLDPGQEDDDGPETYGGRKAVGEQIVVEAFGDAALIVRPGLIVGPHDPTGRFTYWPHRVARGGDVLAPGVARRRSAVHRRPRSRGLDRPGCGRRASAARSTPPARPMRFGDLLERVPRVTASDARLHVDPERAAAREQVGREWMDVPLWLVAARLAGMQQASIERGP